MAKIVFFSLTRQTKKFVNKIEDYEIIQIDKNNPVFEINESFILVTPTYDSWITEPINCFLDAYENRKFCRGIFAGGNRNFAQLYAFTGKNLAKDYQIPILHYFEFQGNNQDVSTLIKELKKIESKSTS